ncbi:hypothetical protein HDR63_01040 [bacterium]|nr:hypothetical protein [bacterium]
MAKATYFTKKPSAAARVFTREYTPFIQDKIMRQYGPSYARVADFGNAWRTKITWSQNIENYAVFQSRLFIRLLGDRSNATNPQFLLALAKMIAEYLAKFCIQAPNPPTRKKATEKLENALYHRYGYIQGLLAKQDNARTN